MYGNVELLEKTLLEKLRKAEDMVNRSLKQRNSCPMQFLKSNFKLSYSWKIEHMRDAKKNLDVFYNIDEYIRCKESSVKRCTITLQARKFFQWIDTLLPKKIHKELPLMMEKEGQLINGIADLVIETDEQVIE